MMDDALRAFVWARAGSRCEYCRLHQDEYEYQTFHVEHIIAKQHGGPDDPDNLCLACSECNWAKGPNLAGLIDGKLYPPLCVPNPGAAELIQTRRGASRLGRPPRELVNFSTFVQVLWPEHNS